MLRGMTISFLEGGRTYPGGKGGTYQHIINLMPPHSRYIETHLGAGAVIRRKRLARVSIGIDLDERVIARWRARGHPEVTIVQGDAVTVLPTLGVGQGDIVYSDPPFLPGSRRRDRIYRHDYKAADHERLIAVLRALPCGVVLSGYRSPLYDQLLRNWHRTDFPARTHAGTVVESAWTNFEPGDVLHDYSFVGDDFRQRERLRRRIRTLSKRLADAEPLERNAALAVLAELRPDAVAAAAGRLA